jgi:hypothetical protein
MAQKVSALRYAGCLKLYRTLHRPSLPSGRQLCCAGQSNRVLSSSNICEDALVDALLAMIHFDSQGKQQLVGAFADGNRFQKEISFG